MLHFTSCHIGISNIGLATTFLSSIRKYSNISLFKLELFDMTSEQFVSTLEEKPCKNSTAYQKRFSAENRPKTREFGISPKNFQSCVYRAHIISSHKRLGCWLFHPVESHQCSAGFVASWTREFMPSLDASHLWDKCESTMPCHARVLKSPWWWALRRGWQQRHSQSRVANKWASTQGPNSWQSKTVVSSSSEEVGENSDAVFETHLLCTS